MNLKAYFIIFDKKLRRTGREKGDKEIFNG